MTSKKPLLRVVAPFAIFAIVASACSGGGASNAPASAAAPSTPAASSGGADAAGATNGPGSVHGGVASGADAGLPAAFADFK